MDAERMKVALEDAVVLLRWDEPANAILALRELIELAQAAIKEIEGTRK